MCMAVLLTGRRNAARDHGALIEYMDIDVIRFPLAVTRLLPSQKLMVKADQRAWNALSLQVVTVGN